MYQALIFCHAIVRWLVLLTLLYAVCTAFRGVRAGGPFTKKDNAIRHWTATIAHIQLVIGMLLYFQSPAVQYFRQHFREAVHSTDLAFFGLIHPLLMLAAITVVTIGSALARRRPSDRSRFRTMLVWFSVALLIILLSIPWPFSPLAARPYFR